MNIISGIYKHKSIKSPATSATHPMGSREKLALFNMISPYCPGASVLDAFAGSGALGLEALSRGASKVVFVEKSPKVAAIIRENIENLGVKDQTSVRACISRDFTTDERFDIIIADPPYDNFHIEDIAHLSVFLKEGGILALSAPRINLPEIPGLEIVSQHTYAAASITIFTKR